MNGLRLAYVSVAIQVVVAVLLTGLLFFTIRINQHGQELSPRCSGGGCVVVVYQDGKPICLDNHDMEQPCEFWERRR